MSLHVAHAMCVLICCVHTLFFTHSSLCVCLLLYHWYQYIGHIFVGAITLITHKVSLYCSHSLLTCWCIAVCDHFVTLIIALCVLCRSAHTTHFTYCWLSLMLQLPTHSQPTHITVTQTHNDTNNTDCQVVVSNLS